MSWDWDYIWKVVGHIADVIGILGLLFTIWQIRTLKTKVEASEIGIRSVLNLHEHERIRLILDNIIEMQNEVISIRTLLSKPGGTEKSIRKRLECVIGTLNRCIVDLPHDSSEISDFLKYSRNSILNFLETGLAAKNSLLDSQCYLDSAIELLKASEKKYVDKEIQMASNQNV